MYEYIVETQNLTKTYHNHISLCGVNLHVPKGKIYGLLGRNGAGKTTTMKLILNLAAPTSGTIFLFGKKAEKKEKQLYYRIGSLIESPGFYKNLTAEENLIILAKLRGQHRRQSVAHALAEVGLEADAKKLFCEFSLGMKQRLGIAAAVMHEPELLILDEPMNGLDPIGIKQLRSYLLQLSQEKGTTILLSSHVLSEVEHLAENIGLMSEGTLIEESNMDKLRENSRQYVEFEVSDVNAAALILEREHFITEYFVTGKNTIRIFQQMNQRNSINSSFVKHGIDVAEIKVCKETLEDYFKQRLSCEQGGLK